MQVDEQRVGAAVAGGLGGLQCASSNKLAGILSWRTPEASQAGCQSP